MVARVSAARKTPAELLASPLFAPATQPARRQHLRTRVATHPHSVAHRRRTPQRRPHHRVNRLRRRRYQLWRAWELKEQFRDLYRTTPPALAAAYLQRWCTSALRSKIPAYQTLVKRIRKHFDGIINAVIWGTSPTAASKASTPKSD